MPNIHEIANAPADPNQRIGYPGLGDEIRALRKIQGFSQEYLASLLGVVWMTVHRWETKQRTIDHGVLKNLIRVCSSDDFKPRTYTHCGVLWTEIGEFREVGPQDAFLSQDNPIPVMPNQYFRPVGDRIILKAIKIVGAHHG